LTLKVDALLGVSLLLNSQLAGRSSHQLLIDHMEYRVTPNDRGPTLISSLAQKLLLPRLGQQRSHTSISFIMPRFGLIEDEIARLTISDRNQPQQAPVTALSPTRNGNMAQSTGLHQITG
jgi:hypothetical protein